VILTCKLVCRRRFPVGVARVAPGVVTLLGIFGAAARDGEGGTSKMIAQQVVHGAPVPHRDALSIRVIVPPHVAGSAAPLEVVADVVGGHTAQRGFDAVAVAVIETKLALESAVITKKPLHLHSEGRFR